MPKELIISITPQETKAAIVENDQVVEIHIERDKEHGVVGAICKGRVTKVLPGMQSAFVDIGLERDAFLYVSDFFEDTEEYDKLVTNAEEQVAKLSGPAAPFSTSSAADSTVPLTDQPLHSNQPRFSDRRGGRSRRSRRFRLRGKHYDAPTTPPAEPAITPPETPSEKVEAPEPMERLAPLPGESLAKYSTSRTPAAEVEKEFTQETLNEDEAETDPGLSELEELEAAGALVLEAVETIESEPDDLEEDAGQSFASDVTLAMEEVASQKTEAAASLGSPILTLDDFNEAAAAATSSTHTESTSTESSSNSLPEMSDASVAAAQAGIVPQSLDPDQAEVTSFSADSGIKLDTNEETTATTQAAVAEAPGTTIVPDSVPQAAPPTPSAASPTKAQFRNSHGTSKFFRRNIDRRRRPGSPGEERTDSEQSFSQPLIGDLLKEGQEILVQIAKEPLGTKGARITSHIALPGRYLVYMPTVDHIGVSRKIESDEERHRLKRIIQENRRGNYPGGFIVRTAGQGKGEDEFKSDINFLYALWAEIKSRADKKRGASFVHRDLNLVQRILRDQLSADFSSIRVDNETEYAAIVEFINRFQPSLVHRVKLYTKDTPIFEEFGIQTEIDKALRNKVWLKSGGYIVIDQAEALVAIDVNTGKYVGKSNKLEDTIVKTNIEAAKEIARQIRLRDLGGIIVCDFIDMEDRKNRMKVTQTLEEALRHDRSPSKILQFNDFGLVAITRKRVKQSLMRALCETCPHCLGSGMVKSAQTVCYEIQGEVKKMAKTLENKEITIRVSPEVAKALKTTEISVVQEIESSLRKDLVIKTDPLLQRERFDIF